MTRIFILFFSLALLAACQQDSTAQGTDSSVDLRVSEAATAIDSPRSGTTPEQDPTPVSESKPTSVRQIAEANPPQDTLKPKAIRMKAAEEFLKKHVRDESIAKQVKVYLQQDEKVSAVRTVSKSTNLELPEAKEFVDSLEVLMGTDKVHVSPRVRVQRKKKEKGY